MHVLALVALLLDAPAPERARPHVESAALLVNFVEAPQMQTPLAEVPTVSLAALATPAVEIPEPALPEIDEEPRDAQPVVRQPPRFTPPRPADSGSGDLAQYAASAALRAGQMVRVILRVEVLRDGSTGSVTIDTTSGNPAADDAAVRYARALRWVPAAMGDDPMTMTIRLPVVFTGTS